MRLVFFLLFPLAAFAQSNHSHLRGRVMKFPAIPGYLTLTSDLHMHSVFSDGSVWPDIRVQEALMDGLDMISLTEHLEYQPHKDDIPHPDRNRAHQLALEEAKDHDLMIFRGSEITRKMPPGHCNAIFIQDANKLLINDSLEVFKEASRQGAFVFWNHPNWISLSHRPDGVATLTPFHQRLISEKLLHGIEVVNELTYSDEALQIALDNNLTIMGTSDIHGLVDWQFGLNKGGHRPLTMVFAKEKSEASVKEALFARRTVVFFNDMLIGRTEQLKPLVAQCIKADSARYIGKTQVLKLWLRNDSPCPMTLKNQSAFRFHNAGEVIRINAFETLELEVKTLNRLAGLSLDFEVLNAVYAPGKHPFCKWQVTPLP
jgi:hypothetical protein